MIRSAVSALLLLSAGLVGSTSGYLQQCPTIRLILPQGTSADGAHIEYVMRGPFGGYGGHLKIEPGRSTYEFVAGVEGKAATMVKGIAYVPGCRIETFDIEVQVPVETKRLSCVPLAEKTLHGLIAPAPVGAQAVQVQVFYMAPWAHKFYGITDGAVTQISIGTAAPDSQGAFEMRVPDFGAQAELGEAELEFLLRESKSWNIIAHLTPDGSTYTHSLKVETAYPSLIRFSAEKW